MPDEPRVPAVGSPELATRNTAAHGTAAQGTAAQGTAGLLTPDTSPAGLDDLRDRLAAAAAEADRDARLPWPSVLAVHEGGLLTAAVGAGFGGPDIGAGAFVDAFSALGAGDPSVALVSLMTAVQHVAAANGLAWPEDLYERVLRESASRPVLVNAARAEPSLGSSSRGGPLETTARRGGSGWIVDGRKSFVTGSEHLDYHAVSVASVETGETARAIVPGDSPGIEIVRSWDSIGMRASSTHDVVYRDVEIPRENLLAHAPPGTRSAPVVGAMFGLGVSAIYLGVARAARDALVAFLTERAPTSLGAPLSTVERLQDATGEVTAQLVTAEETLHSLATRLETGEAPTDPRIAAVKLLCTRASIATVEAAVRAAGSHALGRGGTLERHLRDVLCARPHPPQEDAALRRLGLASLATGRWGSRAHRPAAHAEKTTSRTEKES